MTVDRERMRLLVDALRSGRFQQGEGRLTSTWVDAEDRHCCLGVACLVAIENGLEVTVHRLDASLRNGDACVLYDGADNYLPESVQQWYGLDDRNPLLGSASAADWNDLEHASFGDIADLFEAEYLDDDEGPEDGL